MDYIETGRFSQSSWVTDGELNIQNTSPALVKRRKESPMVKISDASKWGLNSKSEITFQSYCAILNHADVNYTGIIPELTLISTLSNAGSKLFNLFPEQRFGFVSVDRRGAYPINFGSTFRTACSIKECERIHWPNNRLNLFYLKCRLFNIESTERNQIRFFSNIGRERPFVILLVDHHFRFRTDSKYLVNLTVTEPQSGRGRAINAVCGTDNLHYISMIQSITQLRRTVKTTP